MKKPAVFLGVVVALVALALATVIVVGALQPANHVATSRIRIEAMPDAVWRRLLDFETWPRWNSTLDQAVRQADRDGKPYWRFEGSFGPMLMIVEESVTPARLLTRIPADAELGFSGTLGLHAG